MEESREDERLLAGAVMGGVVHAIVAPIERAKLLLQTQESNIGIAEEGENQVLLTSSSIKWETIPATNMRPCPRSRQSQKDRSACTNYLVG
ncbi:hypothetical protein YC2023_031612 [Brassica napus]